MTGSVIASAAKQSIAPQKERMDCFAALAMTRRDRDQFAAAANCFGTASGAVCAISRFISGMQEPQLVPAFSFVPIPATERAPAAMVSQMVLRPTPKQAQTIGPASA